MEKKEHGFLFVGWVIELNYIECPITKTNASYFILRLFQSDPLR